MGGRTLRVIDLSRALTRYQAGLQLQEAIAQDRKADLVADTLLLLQVGAWPAMLMMTPAWRWISGASVRPARPGVVWAAARY